jgi:hypothetical protein
MTAASATELTVTNAKALNLSTSTLAAVEYLTASGAGDFNISGEDLDGITSVEVSNTGEVDFGALGTNALDNSITANFTGSETLDVTTVTTNGQNITVNALSQQGAVTFGDLTSGGTTGNVSLTVAGSGTLALDKLIAHDLTLDVTNNTGAVTYADTISASGDVTIKTSVTNANDLATAADITLSGSAQAVALTGAIGIDQFDFIDSATTSSITITGDLGESTDVLTIDGTNSIVVVRTIDISGLSNYDGATITGSAVKDTIKGGADDDTITGGGGIDTITTGTGNDIVSFDSVILAANASNITDFDAVNAAGTVVDKLQFDAGTFGVTNGGTAVLTAVASLAAGAGTDVIVFDTAANIAADLSASFTGVGATNHVIAIETDTGKIKVDVDGDFTAGAIEIGSITIAEAAALVSGNFDLIA